jgi:hypothetical protein
MFSCVLPCIKLASLPTAMILPEILSLLLMGCQLRLYHYVIKVLYQGSIAISSVMKSKNPISFQGFKMLKLGAYKVKQINLK